MPPRRSTPAHRETKLAAECFRVPYLGSANVATYNRVCELRERADPEKYYSVYSAFIQSSAMGKTRATLEMSKLGVYICYCSTASRTSSAYPARTPYLADKLCVGLTEVKAVLYLKAWIVVLKKMVDSGMLPTAWMQSQIDSDVVFKAVSEEWCRLDTMEVDEEDMEMDSDSKNIDLVREEMQALQTVLSSQQQQPPVHNDVCVQVVFVFDEARGLLAKPAEDSPFYNLRRALRVFFSYDKFFALVLDTDPKVLTMLPLDTDALGDDQSARARPIGMSLLPAVYYTPTVNLYRPRPDLSREEYASPSTWLRYGRPLWAARLDMDKQTPDETKWDFIIPFAGLKLVGDLQLKDEQGKVVVDVLAGKMTQSQAMAMLGAAAGLDICPRSVIPGTLVASHMSILLRVTEGRVSKMFLTSSVEPILSEAAGRYFRLSKDVQVGALTHFLDTCKQGYVTPGAQGEFVAKYILVAAVWSLRGYSRFCLRPIPVEKYLEKLLRNTSNDRNVFGRLQSRLSNLKGDVFFNSFVALSKPPDADMLRNCWIAGRAIMYKAESNFPGADLLIPVWSEAGMTALVISVKNLQHAGWLEELSVEKVRCEFTQIEVAADLPVVAITMSLREPVVKAATSWLLWEEPDAADEKKYTHLTCYGIKSNYGFLGDRVKQLLADVLVTVPDPLYGCTEQEKEWFEDMLRMTQPV